MSLLHGLFATRIEILPITKKVFCPFTIPESVSTRRVRADQSTQTKSSKRVKTKSSKEAAMIRENDQVSSELLEYYFRACFSPHETLFDFEERYSYDFLKSIGRRPFEGGDWMAVLDDATDDSSFEDFCQRCEEYERDRSPKKAKFSFLYLADSWTRGWDMSVGAMRGEEYPTMDGFLKTFEFLTGVKADRDRFFFIWRGSREIHRIDDAELVTQAVENGVHVGIVPHSGHIHDSLWSTQDIIPMIVKYVQIDDP
ncbi:hypothetical protein PSACC_01617 [Paramicrosporidium saccamoebae]|uniref:Uncharacterized protein n=1 Tax=Paramicrosporidium saccamoebae TaxID=1246581 RepID=A0A2H9TLH0_9FUNG|nr:hypothetical protein PSACC_01617 [Paramicrosporidium saccamoebae]